MSLFQKKQTSYLGVDIGAHGIKLVEFKQSKNRPQLWTYGITHESTHIHAGAFGGNETNDATLTASGEHGDTSDEQAKKFGLWLKDLVKKSKATTTTAIASLPVSYIFHTLVTLPESDKKRITQLVRAEVTKFLPRPIEEMQITHQVIPQTKIEKQKKYVRVLVTAAPKFLIQFYTKIFQYAGLQLTELETEAFALTRSFIGKDQSTAMIVDIGAERSNFFIIDQGLPMTTRSIQIGGNHFGKIIDNTLGIETAMSKQVKYDLSSFGPNKVDPTLFQEPLGAMIKEIQYNFDVFLRQVGNEGKRPEKIILTGGSAVIPAIQERLQKEFPMKVFIGDPWARVVYQERLKQRLDIIGPRMSVSIGLAMRNILG